MRRGKVSLIEHGIDKFFALFSTGQSLRASRLSSAALGTTLIPIRDPAVASAVPTVRRRHPLAMWQEASDNFNLDALCRIGGLLISGWISFWGSESPSSAWTSCRFESEKRSISSFYRGLPSWVETDVS